MGAEAPTAAPEAVVQNLSASSLQSEVLTPSITNSITQHLGPTSLENHTPLSMNDEYSFGTYQQQNSPSIQGLTQMSLDINSSPGGTFHSGGENPFENLVPFSPDITNETSPPSTIQIQETFSTPTSRSSDIVNLYLTLFAQQISEPLSPLSHNNGTLMTGEPSHIQLTDHNVSLSSVLIHPSLEPADEYFMSAHPDMFTKNDVPTPLNSPYLLSSPVRSQQEERHVPFGEEREHAELFTFVTLIEQPALTLAPSPSSTEGLRERTQTHAIKTNDATPPGITQISVQSSNSPQEEVTMNSDPQGRILLPNQPENYGNSPISLITQDKLLQQRGRRGQSEKQDEKKNLYFQDLETNSKRIYQAKKETAELLQRGERLEGQMIAASITDAPQFLSDIVRSTGKDGSLNNLRASIRRHAWVTSEQAEGGIEKIAQQNTAVKKGSGGRYVTQAEIAEVLNGRKIS